ncbi:MAG: DUF5615 family PIN-like protein [Gemmatimonadota bacterium]|nr:DUF5615 family PIN-like protein [Gemmatimonadota bacterium]
MIRLLADENFPLPSVRLLRKAGYDVGAIAEEAPGAPDPEVLFRANAQGRVLLTFDRDFGELIFVHQLPAPAGVLYLRFVAGSPEEPAAFVLKLLTEQDIQLNGRFTVADRRRIRQKPLLRSL